MNKLARASLAVLSVGLFFGFSSPAHAAKYQIHWYLGHQNLDYFEQAAADFKKNVETASHGDIAVQIVTAASDRAGDGAAQSPTTPEIATKVEKGEIEMGHSFTDVMGAVDPRLYAFEAPFLMRDYRHMEGVFEGPVGADLLDAGFRAHNMVGLSFTYSGGSSGVASVSREIRKPEDLKGLKVGVYGDAVNEAWLKSLGATPVAIGHRLPDILKMAQNGSLDAVVITWRNFERESLVQGFKYYALPGSTYLVSVTYINKKFFESMPAEYQTLIKTASLEAGRTERARTIDLNESAKREMLGKGVRPLYLSEQNRRSFAAALKPAYENAIEKILGKDLVEKIRKTGDAPNHPLMPSDFAGR
jgi:TRAP-type C4-dicarboxylate transport system substrate-binding protein